jgi:hypothetical protein
VGEHIGQFTEVDLDHNGNAMEEFMRIKVRMDITEPITRFITLEIEDDEGEKDQTNAEMMNNEENGNKDKEGERKIITFKYEYLPNFCYNCGIIGHTEKSCPSRNRREGTGQFGPNLRAVIYKGSSSEERSRSSSEKGNFWLTNSAETKASKEVMVHHGGKAHNLIVMKACQRREMTKKSRAFWKS